MNDFLKSLEKDMEQKILEKQIKQLKLDNEHLKDLLNQTQNENKELKKELQRNLKQQEIKDNYMIQKIKELETVCNEQLKHIEWQSKQLNKLALES